MPHDNSSPRVLCISYVLAVLCHSVSKGDTPPAIKCKVCSRLGIGEHVFHLDLLPRPSYALSFNFQLLSFEVWSILLNLNLFILEPSTSSDLPIPYSLLPLPPLLKLNILISYRIFLVCLRWVVYVGICDTMHLSWSKTFRRRR